MSAVITFSHLARLRNKSTAIWYPAHVIDDGAGFAKWLDALVVRDRPRLARRSHRGC